jgi:MobA/MobL family
VPSSGRARRPSPLAAAFLGLSLSQHDQRVRQFLNAESVGARRDDQLAELLHLAALEVSRLALERSQLGIEVPRLAHDVLQVCGCSDDSRALAQMLYGYRDGARRRGPSRDFFEGGRAYTSFRRALRRVNDRIAMAIYHLHVKVIGRKSGSSAVASAAYRSASRLRDDRLERTHDFSAKRGVVHSEIMLPEKAPQAWSGRERLWNDVEAFEVMHRSGVREDCLDVSEVDAQSYGACPLAGPILAKLNETLTVEFGNFAGSKSALQETKARRLRPADGLSDFMKVRHMQANEIAECFGVTSLSFDRRLAAVDASFLVDRPSLAVLSTEKRLADILPFPANLNSPGAGFELREGRHGLCAPCALSCRKAAKSVVSRRTLECTRRDLCNGTAARKADEPGY